MFLLRLVIAILLCSQMAFTQVFISNPYSTGSDIIYVEYFWDEDPGLGAGNSLSITAGQDVTFSGVVNMSALPNGPHILHTRAKDNQGKWSLMQSQLVYKSIDELFDYSSSGGDIIYVEYFFDTDPGLGMGTSLPITQGQDVTFMGDINMSALSNGPHILHVRAKDTQGEWSLMQSHHVYKSIDELFDYSSPGQDIVAAEYFVDSEPGLGFGTSIAVSAAQDVCLNDVVCVSGLTSGEHYVHVRVKDQSGKWSLMQIDTFEIGLDCEIFDPLDVQVFCDDNNTPDVYHDDRFDFSMIVRGVNITSGYTISGDVMGTGIFDCQIPTTFDNGGIGYPTQDGDLSFDITDDLDPTCLKNWTIEVPLPEPLSCSAANAYLDASGTVTLTPSLFNSSNTCGVDTITLSQDQFDCTQLGVHNITLNMLDVKGNMDQCMVDVTILDTIAPSVLTQDITVQLDITGNISILPSDIDNGSFDNCTIASIVLDVMDFTCNELGPNTVSLTVTDVSGNSKSVSALVTVQDHLPPVISCQDITIQLDATGQASITAADVSAVIIDNCGIASSQLDRNTFDCTTQGSQQVLLTIMDTSGNPSTCFAFVEVEDPLEVCCQNVEDVNVDPIPDGTYSAIIKIHSQSTVPANGSVIFHAGTSICLDPDFEVNLGAVFEAFIEACID